MSGFMVVNKKSAGASLGAVVGHVPVLLHFRCVLLSDLQGTFLRQPVTVRNLVFRPGAAGFRFFLCARASERLAFQIDAA